MFKFMKRMIFGNNLHDVLDETKVIRINGVRFIIKKIGVLDYASGAKVLLQYHETYKSNAKENKPMDTNLEKKAKEHYSHVLVAGVVSPRLSHFDDGVGVFIDKVFVDFELVEKLYTEIMTFSYGKKKVQMSNSLKKDY